MICKGTTENNYIQAYIVNLTYQSSFENIVKYDSNVEKLINEINQKNGFLEEWTAPRWAGIGDIVFFMQSKGTAQTIFKHQKRLYDMGKTNMSYKEFFHLLPEFCLVKAEGPAVMMNNWMTYPETENDLVYPKSCGFKETLIIENMDEIPELDGLKSYYTFENTPGKNPEIAIIGFDVLKEYVFNHSDEIGYFWTDYDMAIPTIKEIALNRELYERYGGKIFAVGKVCSIPKYNHENLKELHWGSPIYANYDEVTLLEHPIDISEFREYITVSRGGAITPVLGESFSRLKGSILQRNKVQVDLENASANPVTLAEMTEENWLEVTRRFGRKFALESQFRAFYVDRFLKVLCGSQRIYRECVCYNDVRNSRPRVDNIILFGRKYLPVEVKLNVKIENDIIMQCASYCEIVKCELNPRKTIQASEMYDKVLVIDTSFIYLYDHEDKSFEMLKPLDSISRKEDIGNLSRLLEQRLNS